MVEREQSTTLRRQALAVVMAVGVAGVGFFATVGTSSADVSAVSGSAYGASVNLSVAGATVTFGPAPSVTLPASGGNESASLATISVPGYLEAGLAEVATQGATGAGGSSASSASLADATIVYENLLTAGAVQSSCAASEQGVSGQTTILALAAPSTAGTVVNYQPGPNTRFVLPGGITVIFNEQIAGENEITVNAVHVIIDNDLTGTTGDIILSQSHCDVVRAPATTTTTTTTPTSTTSTSTTTTSTSTTTTTTPTTTTTVKCNSGSGNASETEPGNDCDPGKSTGKNKGGD